MLALLLAFTATPLTDADGHIVGAIETLRDVTADDQGRVHVQITPTYSGCPAMETIRADLIEALTAAGYRQVCVEFVLSPAWTTDEMTDAGRAKLRDLITASPAGRELLLQGERFSTRESE